MTRFIPAPVRNCTMPLAMNLCAFRLIFSETEPSHVKGLAVMSSLLLLRGGSSRLDYLQAKLARRRAQTPDRVAPVLFLIRFEALLDVAAAVP